VIIQIAKGGGIAKFPRLPITHFENDYDCDKMGPGFELQGAGGR
jgi:hypothetical protein